MIVILCSYTQSKRGRDIFLFVCQDFCKSCGLTDMYFGVLLVVEKRYTEFQPWRHHINVCRPNEQLRTNLKFVCKRFELAAEIRIDLHAYLHLHTKFRPWRNHIEKTSPAPRTINRDYPSNFTKVIPPIRIHRSNKYSARKR